MNMIRILEKAREEGTLTCFACVYPVENSQIVNIRLDEGRIYYMCDQCANRGYRSFTSVFTGQDEPVISLEERFGYNPGNDECLADIELPFVILQNEEPTSAANRVHPSYDPLDDQRRTERMASERLELYNRLHPQPEPEDGPEEEPEDDDDYGIEEDEDYGGSDDDYENEINGDCQRCHRSNAAVLLPLPSGKKIKLCYSCKEQSREGQYGTLRV